MREHIYLDNFRGFQNTIVPVDSTTFLVGENSSGKSSFISLFDILHDYMFWGDTDFNSELYNLGSFSDIVSQSAVDKSYFTIGLSRYFRDKKKNKVFSFLVSFKSADGLPSPYRFTLTNGDDIIFLRDDGKNYYYKILNIFEQKINLNTENVFKLVSSKHNQKSTRGFKRIRLNMRPDEKEFIFYLPSLVLSREYSNEDSTPNVISFPSQLYSHRTIWFAPIRTKPRKMYAGFRKKYSAEGEHTPFLLKKKLSSTSEAEKFRDILKKFGNDSGLFDDIKIHPYSDDDSSPFEVQICLNEEAYSLDNVGYGVSQILPIVTEMITREKGEHFNIQQPEVHLHPKAQAALGELIHKLMELDNKKFLIETHSEFLIDRFRISLRESEKKSTSSILWFERREGHNHIHKINLNADGSYDRKHPQGFREFFLKEKINLLGI